MPVEIVIESTDSRAGRINQNDMDSMKSDFIDEVNLIPANGRNQIVKKYSVSVMKDELKRLIEFYEQNENFKVITINFAVNPQSFLSCNGKDDSNSLNIVVEAAEFMDQSHPENGMRSYTGVGDCVVIPSFYGVARPPFMESQPPCCPSSNP